jgi:hypothetical protein
MKDLSTVQLQGSLWIGKRCKRCRGKGVGGQHKSMVAGPGRWTARGREIGRAVATGQDVRVSNSPFIKFPYPEDILSSAAFRFQIFCKFLVLFCLL